MNSGESAPQHPTLPSPHPLLTCYHTSDCVLVLLYIYAFYLILISPLFFFTDTEQLQSFCSLFKLLR